MSLDVYLDVPGQVVATDNEYHIYVREDGATKEISREEWDRKNPGIEPCAVRGRSEHAFHANITHNLGEMASEVYVSATSLYFFLWRPEEIGTTKAYELIVPLAQGLTELYLKPDKYKALNPENGWGSYEGLVTFVAKYLNACCEHPMADVSVSR